MESRDEPLQVHENLSLVVAERHSSAPRHFFFVAQRLSFTCSDPMFELYCSSLDVRGLLQYIEYGH